MRSFLSEWRRSLMPGFALACAVCFAVVAVTIATTKQF